MYLSPAKLKRFRINRYASNAVRPQHRFHIVFDRPYKAIVNVLARSIKINQNVTCTCHARLAINKLVRFNFQRCNAWLCTNTGHVVATSLGFLKTFQFTRPNYKNTHLFSNVSLLRTSSRRLFLVWVQSENELQRTRFQSKTP